MSTEDKQRINLYLDAHHVTLEIDRDKEPFYRQAASLLNRRYQRYLKSRPSASVEQLWVYVALDVAVNLCSDAREKDLEPVAEQLSKLNQQINNLLDTPNEVENNELKENN